MRIAVLSDIHGNIDALDAVLADLHGQTFDRVVCLGDIATLGPCPAECVRALEDKDWTFIIGNHEQALLDPDRSEDFGLPGQVLKETAFWGRSKLTRSELDFLAGFKSFHTEQTERNRYGFYHGTPNSTTIGILPDDDFATITSRFSGEIMPNVCVGGHTHYQMFRKLEDRVVANPGSVGCSFSYNGTSGSPPQVLPKAEYMIIDESDGILAFDLRSIDYDFATHIARVEASDLPLKDWWKSEYERVVS